MISAKEARHISFINDTCKKYLNSIESYISNAANNGEYEVRIIPSEINLDFNASNGNHIKHCIVDHLKNLGYNTVISNDGTTKTIVISWGSPETEE